MSARCASHDRILISLCWIAVKPILANWFLYKYWFHIQESQYIFKDLRDLLGAVYSTVSQASRLTCFIFQELSHLFVSSLKLLGSQSYPLLLRTLSPQPRGPDLSLPPFQGQNQSQTNLDFAVFSFARL